MNMQKLVGLILLVGGGVLLYFGFMATDSVVEEVSETVTGRYTDKTMWYLVGGGVAAVAGLFLALKK